VLWAKNISDLFLWKKNQVENEKGHQEAPNVAPKCILFFLLNFIRNKKKILKKKVQFSNKKKREKMQQPKSLSLSLSILSR
jgi:hypothetical protein